MKIVRKIAWIVALLAVIGLFVVALLPKALPVETGTVTRGALVVTVDGDGKTRIKDRFVISAPVGGQMPRMALHPGDRVALDATLFTITPIEPPLLDARSRAQAEGQTRAARAQIAGAKARIQLATTTLEQSKSEGARTKALHEKGVLAKAELDNALFRERAAQAELDSAEFGAKVAQYELQSAEAALLRLKPSSGRSADGEPSVAVKSPVAGTVLRVLSESAGVVSPGAPILEIGDPVALEIVVDLLSTDAVAVKPGALVHVERWGGEAPLQGRVRLVEPSGFTKISALGIEEQRVNVIVDFEGPKEAREALGDGYRVLARIVVWEGASVVKVPQTALFRRADAWAVFVVDGDRARLRTVTIGRRAGPGAWGGGPRSGPGAPLYAEAEVLDGLSEGDRVVVHPGDKLADNAKIVAH